MTPDDLVVATEAYDYPLTLDHLLHAALTVAPGREIVYGDRARHDYRELRRRIGCLAAGLASLGVGPGATVAVMDWDSPRYLECFFAIPMMGAVLHTINVRLSPEQILYTVNHAEDDVILVHENFIPLVAQIRDRFRSVPTLVLVRDDDTTPVPAHRARLRHRLRFAARAWRRRPRVPGRSTSAPARPHSTPPEPPATPRACGTPTASSCCTHSGRWEPSRAAAATRGCTATTSTCPSRRCFTCTAGACPSSPPCSRSSRSIPAATSRRRCCGSSSARE